MAKTRRARIDTENGHRQATMLSLRIIVKETRCYTTSYLRAPSGTIEHERGSREVCYDEAIVLHGCWLPTRCETFGRRAQAHISGVTAPAHCPRCSRHSMRIRGQETPKPDPRGQRSPRRAPLDAPLVAAASAPPVTTCARRPAALHGRNQDTGPGRQNDIGDREVVRPAAPLAMRKTTWSSVLVHRRGFWRVLAACRYIESSSGGVLVGRSYIESR